MPVKSKAQNAAMHAAAAGKSTIGIPQKVGREFVAASRDQKIAALPTKVGRDRHATPAGRTKHS